MDFLRGAAADPVHQESEQRRGEDGGQEDRGDEGVLDPTPAALQSDPTDIPKLLPLLADADATLPTPLPRIHLARIADHPRYRHHEFDLGERAAAHGAQ